MEIEIAQKMIELRAAGRSIRSIACELEMPKTTVSKRLQILAYEVETAVAIVKDHWLEKLKLDQVAVFEAKLKLYKKLQRLIAVRDFSDVPTHCLVKIWSAIGQELKAENCEKPIRASLPLELRLMKMNEV